MECYIAECILQKQNNICLNTKFMQYTLLHIDKPSKELLAFVRGLSTKKEEEKINLLIKNNTMTMKEIIHNIAVDIYAEILKSTKPEHKRTGEYRIGLDKSLDIIRRYDVEIQNASTDKISDEKIEKALVLLDEYLQIVNPIQLGIFKIKINKVVDQVYKRNMIMIISDIINKV